MTETVVTPQVDAWASRSSATAERLLSTGSGGGTFGGMDSRVTALETHFEYMRRDLDELKSGQSEINRILADVSAGLTRTSAQMTTDKAEIRSDITLLRVDMAKLPTNSDLTSWKLQWTAIGFAMVALIVGGVIGGLGWLASIIPSS